MAGHSKWSNIKRKKEAADAQRGKIFTKIGREIQVAVRSGGPDPETNNRLKDAISKAKAANVPNDNIMRSINRAAGTTEGENYEDILYEGYGPGGVAVMVKTLTENRNRTAGDLRHIFDKHGGNLGTSGCVSFLFEDKGVLILSKEEAPDEETAMLDALEAGAEDIADEDEVFEIITTPQDYSAVLSALEAKEYNFLDVSCGPVPLNWAKAADPDQAARLEKMIDLLEEHDDVQEVYHNWEREED